MKYEDLPRHDPAPSGKPTHRTEDAPAAKGAFSSGRRQFLKRAAITTAPVLVTVASRPAFGNPCSVSGMMSGNASITTPVVCAGLSPGFWGTHPAEWPLGYDPGTVQSDTNLSVFGKILKKQGVQHDYNPDGTLFNDVFDPIFPEFDGLTLMQVIQLQGNTDRYQLGAQAVAALLNAAHFSTEEFGYTELQIIDMFNQNALSDPSGLQELFKMLNHR